jgi:hypothetical protein
MGFISVLFLSSALSHTDVRELPAYAFASTATRVASTPNSLLYIIDFNGLDALVNEAGEVFAVDHEAAPFCVVVAGGFSSEDFIERSALLF